MDCESDYGEVLEKKTSPDNKHMISSPRIKVINTDHGGGSGPHPEATIEEFEHGSIRSSDSSDTATSSSSKASSENIIHVNPQMPPEFIGENNITEPTGGSNMSEESVIECPESTSQLLDVNHAFLVERMSPTLSPFIVMECPEVYVPNNPASTFDSSKAMEGSATPDDQLFSIHIEDSGFSTYDETRMCVGSNKLGELSRSGQSFRSGKLCQPGEPSKPRELCQSGETSKLCVSGEIYKLRECKSPEHLKSNDLKGLGELVRFFQASKSRELCQSGEIHKLRKCKSLEHLKSNDLEGSGELVRICHPSKSRELCQFGEASKLCQSGEIHKLRECRSPEHLESNDFKGSGELVRFCQPSKSRASGEPSKLCQSGEIHRLRECRSPEHLESNDFKGSGVLVKFCQPSKSRELFQSGEPSKLCQSGEIHNLRDSKSPEHLKSSNLKGSGELVRFCQPSKPEELCQAGENHKLRECQSPEHLKSRDIKGSGELVRFRQTSLKNKGVGPNKKLENEKAVTEEVKHGENRLASPPMNDVPKAIMNNQVYTNVGDSRDIGSKPFPLPKKKKSSTKLCHCFKWPSFSCKCIR